MYDVPDPQEDHVSYLEWRLDNMKAGRDAAIQRAERAENECSLLASAADRLNTMAREHGLGEAEREEDIVALIGRTWATLTTQRQAIAELRVESERMREALSEIKLENQTLLESYEKIGPQWTSRETGHEYYDASSVREWANEAIKIVDVALEGAAHDRR